MSVRRNLLANLAGSAWSALAGLVFVPFYLVAVGAEGYGLIGFYVTLASVFAILDGGLVPAVTRLLAENSGSASGGRGNVSDTLFTLECLFMGMALLIGAACWLASGVIAVHWLSARSLPNGDVIDAIRWMGAALVFQWPFALYAGGLVALQRQVSLNVLNSITAAARGLAALAAFHWIGPTVSAFFIAQTVVMLVNLLAARYLLWGALSELSSSPRFSIRGLRDIGSFAVGVGTINLLSLLLTQADKVLLSALLPLDQFGVYSLATMLSRVLSRVNLPIFNATYPRLTQLVAAGAETQTAEIFHKASALMAVAVLPASAALIVFGQPLIAFWTDNATTTPLIYAIFIPLIAGTAFNSMMQIPYGIQLAHGWTSLAIWQNLAALAFTLPATWALARYDGALGAALVWPALNLGYLLVSAPLMFRRYPELNARRWYRYAVIAPMFLMSALAWIAQIVVPVPQTCLGILALLAGVSIVGALVIIATTPDLSRMARSLINELP